MFPKKQRLAKNNDIEAVFKQKKASFNKLLGIRFLNNKLDYNRYTVIIGTKVSKKAVERNRIKRIIKSKLREYDSHIKPCIDCIVLVLPEARDKDKKKINDALCILLKKTKLI